jgi:DNA-binding GntR family transcriptional regulator
MKFQELMHPVFVFSKQNYEHYFQPINRILQEEKKIITHVDILEKLKTRDAEGYRNAMRMHLRPYWEFLYNYTDK